MTFTLNSILTKPLSAEEYLKSKQAESAENFARTLASFRKEGEDAKRREQILWQAEQYMQNLYLLPGTGGKAIFVGDPPHWNKRTVPDEEFLWSLNRMPELSSLTTAYLMTGEEKYAEKAIVDLMSWIDGCPRPLLKTDSRDYVCQTFNGLSPWRVFEVAIRLESTWKQAYSRLLYSPQMTPEIHEKLVLSMYEQAEVLFVAPTIIRPNADSNHCLVEALGLLAAACAYPEWNTAEQWRDKAIHEILRCCERQITPEGGQMEGCPGYHSVCLDMLYSAARILRESGIEIPAEFADYLNRADDYAAWMLKPSGLSAAIGDTPLNFGVPEGLAQKHKNIFGDLGNYSKIRTFLSFADAAEKTEPLPGGIRHYRTIGQIAARTGWSRTDSAFILCCCSPVPNGHSHQDPMSFLLTLEGTDVVIDPSYYTYMNGDKRKLYKSPEVHSCLTFGGRPPFEYLSTWSFGPQKEGRTRNTYEAPRLLAGDASHANYEPNEHRRLCALVDKDVFLVADDVKNVTGETVRLYFHMDDPSWKLTKFGASSEKIFAYLPGNTEWETAEGGKSPTNDIELPTCRIILTDAEASEDALYITLFSTCSEIDEISGKRTGDGIAISYRKAGETFRLLWKFAESCSLL